MRAGLIPEAWVPPPRIRSVRDLLSYRAAMMGTRLRLENRIRSTFVKKGLLPPKTPFGPTGQAWLDTERASLSSLSSIHRPDGPLATPPV
jgi:hypothetical protein